MMKFIFQGIPYVWAERGFRCCSQKVFAPEKEASLLLCEEHHREQWRFLNWQEKAFSLLLSSHIRYTRCSDIER